VRVLVAAGTGIALLAVGGPAAAGSGSSGPIGVTIDDVVLRGYDCTRAPVRVDSTVQYPAGWTVGVLAGPVGEQGSAGAAFSGRGPGVSQGTLRVCPSLGSGAWTARVDTRVFLTFASFDVPFVVSKVATRTRIVRARATSTRTRVVGEVRTDDGVPGRAVVKITGLRKQKWRLLGHTVMRAKGTFRLVSPRRVRAVRAEYLGDEVTLPSRDRAKAAVRRVSTSSSP
jgi:hypothetical protein